MSTAWIISFTVPAWMWPGQVASETTLNSVSKPRMLSVRTVYVLSSYI
jgi:hypothetical protein